MSYPLEFSTHRYCDHQKTTQCANGCGAYMGPASSGGPEPFGFCPKETTAAPCKVCGRIPQPFGQPSVTARDWLLELDSIRKSFPGGMSCVACYKWDPHEPWCTLDAYLHEVTSSRLHGVRTPPTCSALLTSFGGPVHKGKIAAPTPAPARECGDRYAPLGPNYGPCRKPWGHEGAHHHEAELGRTPTGGSVVNWPALADHFKPKDP